MKGAKNGPSDKECVVDQKTYKQSVEIYNNEGLYLKVLCMLYLCSMSSRWRAMANSILRRGPIPVAPLKTVSRLPSFSA